MRWLIPDHTEASFNIPLLVVISKIDYNVHFCSVVLLPSGSGPPGGGGEDSASSATLPVSAVSSRNGSGERRANRNSAYQNKGEGSVPGG